MTGIMMLRRKVIIGISCVPFESVSMLMDEDSDASTFNGTLISSKGPRARTDRVGRAGWDVQDGF